jgi:hypothetical protein
MAEELKKGIPGAKLVLFEESAHSPHLEEPERFNEVIGEFLGGSTAEAPKASAAKAAPAQAPAPKPAAKAAEKKPEKAPVKKAAAPAPKKPEKKPAGAKKPAKRKR